jgi:hypothetical protein
MKLKVFSFHTGVNGVDEKYIEQQVNDFIGSDKCKQVVKYTTNTITTKVIEQTQIMSSHSGLLIITILYVPA